MKCKHRCHITYVQPMDYQLRIYTGEQGHEYMMQDVRRMSGQEDYTREITPGCFTAVGCRMFMHIADTDEHDFFMTVVHEALHCTTYCWDSVGANLDIYKNDEVTAYTQGHIIDLVMTALLSGEDDVQN